MATRIIPPDVQRYCDELKGRLEPSYLQHADTEPWRQSGASGPMDRWTSLRKPIADCIEHDGSVLDLCCANGFLLECLLRWTGERNVRLTPYGLDISTKLIDLARRRLPQHADHLYVGNAFVWQPPVRMDFVSTMADLFPPEHVDDYVRFVILHHLKPTGRLLIHHTGARGQAQTELRRWVNLDRFNQVGHHIGHDPVKDHEVYVAILAPGDSAAGV